MARDEASARRPRYYGLFWRWHFFAALIVVPFVLWQSTTGTLYLWSEAAMDAFHPALRFVTARAHAAPPSRQIAAALAAVPREIAPVAASSLAHTPMGMAMAPGGMGFAAPRNVAGGPPVLSILLAGDPRRSTTVLLQGSEGLPHPVFVDPYTARVLGQLTPGQWWPGWSRALHGGWPLGAPGSWLLELGDGWAILMILSGFYLWWPRGRSFPRCLWPRFRCGLRTMLRDLHATVAVLFSTIFLFFLISALPWTSFWGGTLLRNVEAVTGQASPAGFSDGGASPAQIRQALPSLDQAVGEARARGVQGTLDIRLSPWPGAPWWMANVRTLAPDHTLQADSTDGRIASDVTASQTPAIPRFVALGIHVHQGDFGPVNLGLNTAFALSLVWLAATGTAQWWLRRPRGRIAPPPRPLVRWPRPLIAAAAAMMVVLPIFGMSVVLIAAAERATRAIVLRAAARRASAA